MHKKHVLPKWDIPPHKELFCFRETSSTWIDIDHKFKACFREANRKLEDEVARYLKSIHRQKPEKTRCKSRQESCQLKDYSKSQLNPDLKKEKKQRPRRERRQMDQCFVDPAIQSKSCFSLALSSASASSFDDLWPYKKNGGKGSEQKKEEFKDVQKKDENQDTVTGKNKNRSLLEGLKQFFIDILSSRYYDTLCRPTLLMVSLILAVRYFSSLRRSDYFESVRS